MADKIILGDDSFLDNPLNSDKIMPRTLYSEFQPERTKQGADFFTGLQGMMGQVGLQGGTTGILRNPSRRFYDPEVTATAIYLPRDFKTKNRWNRWFYAHDEVVGTVLDFHAELPYSQAELLLDDHMIKRAYEDCLDYLNFFSMMPLLDLEYLKIGEVFIHMPWDAEKGRWRKIIPLNPDLVEVKFSPYADNETIIELIPDPELKKIVHSTKPEEQQLKKRIPSEIIKRVISGKNIVLDSDEVTHIARKNNPNDVRGTSIISRLWRCYIPGTSVRMHDGSLKNIEEINVGDKVISKNGEARDIVDTVSYDIEGTVVELQVGRGTPLVSTTGHEYLIRRKYCACGCGEPLDLNSCLKRRNYLKNHNLVNMNKIGSTKISRTVSPIYKIEKVAAEDIKSGDQLLTPITRDIINTDLTEDTARLIGYYVAEGSTSINKRGYMSITWALNTNETNTIAADIIQILQHSFNISAYINKDKGNAIKVNVTKQEDCLKLHSFINTYVLGNRAYNKRFTDVVFNLRSELQMQLLYGEFLGDGTSSGNYVKCCTVSKILGQQISWLLLNNGYPNRITTFAEREHVITMGNISHSRETYIINMSGSAAKLFSSACFNKAPTHTFENTNTYTIAKTLADTGHSYSYIAKYLNKIGKGCKGGSFYASTVKVILRNKGYNCTGYSYNMDTNERDDKYLYSTVTKTALKSYSGRVYDITVDTNHWWLADGAYVTSNTLMYEDKLREAQITIADNFVYPLKIFKLGDPNKGWIPNENHQRALAQMLQQAQFDPNFSLIYHYGLNVEYVTVADKVMRLEKEWQNIDAKKMIALGVSQQFLQGGDSFSSANVGLQTQLARYKAKRDLFEIRWIRDKLFRIMAEKNEWYRRDKAEINHQYRVKRSPDELRQRLMIPDLLWHKKLMLRDDQSFLTFLNNVYAQGKGPIAAETLIMAMGMDLHDELKKKRQQKLLEQQVGEFVQAPAPAAPGGAAGLLGGGAPPMGGMPGMATPPAAPGAAPAPGGIKAVFNSLFKKAKVEPVKEAQAPTQDILVDDLTHKPVIESNYLNGFQSNTTIAHAATVETTEVESAYSLLQDTIPVSDKVWLKQAQLLSVPMEVSSMLVGLHRKLALFDKKYMDENTAFVTEKTALIKALQELYTQGKLAAYGVTDFLPIYTQYYSKDDQLKDYSDVILFNQIADWYDTVIKSEFDFSKKVAKIRNFGNICYAIGQLKGYQEQGINNVKLNNVVQLDGTHYKISQLLDKEYNMDIFVSPNGEVPLFMPCIEGYDDPEFGNNIEPQINRYKDFIVDTILIKSCPIEYVRTVATVVNKLNRFLKKKYSCLSFVQDVIDLPEWEQRQTEIYKKEAVSADEPECLIADKIKLDRLQKRGSVATLDVNKTLYISNWLGMEEVPFTTNLLKHIGIYSDDSLIKQVAKIAKAQSYDLSADELETYRVFNYIEPVMNSNTCKGYKIASEQIDTLPYKVKQGQSWDASGKCLVHIKKTAQELFNENLRLWIDYPHMVDEFLQNIFEEVL